MFCPLYSCCSLAKHALPNEVNASSSRFGCLEGCPPVGYINGSLWFKWIELTMRLCIHFELSFWRWILCWKFYVSEILQAGASIIFPSHSNETPTSVFLWYQPTFPLFAFASWLAIDWVPCSLKSHLLEALLTGLVYKISCNGMRTELRCLSFMKIWYSSSQLSIKTESLPLPWWILFILLAALSFEALSSLMSVPWILITWYP